MAGADAGGSPRPRREIQDGRLANRPAEDRARARLAWSIGGAVVAAVAMAFLIEALQRPGREARERSSLSTRADGFRGLFEVARKLGFEAERHRHSYGRLPPPEEAVLLVLDPLPEIDLYERHSAGLDESQVESLRHWIKRGGRAVASLPGRDLFAALGLETRGRRRRAAELGLGNVIDAMLAGPRPGTRWSRADGPVTGGGALEGFRDAWPPPVEEAGVLASTYLKRPGEAFTLERLQGGAGPLELTVFDGEDREGFTVACRLGKDPLILRKEEGEGSLFLVATSYPFSNIALERGGTARLAAALLDAATEGGRRRLVFDEFCHGLWPRRGLFGWITDTPLLYPVLAAAAVLAALAWRGAVRLGPAAAVAAVPRRAKEEFVISLADIALRARRHRAAARWILDAHRSRLAARTGAPGEGAAGAEPAEIAALAARLDAVKRFQETDLRAFVHEVEETARKLAGLTTEDTGKHAAHR